MTTHELKFITDVDAIRRDFADALARIPKYSAKQIEDMLTDYEHHVRRHGRDPVIVGVGTSSPTERVWSADYVVAMANPNGMDAWREACSVARRELAAQIAADPPPSPAPRGVVLALAGWAS